MCTIVIMEVFSIIPIKVPRKINILCLCFLIYCFHFQFNLEKPKTKGSMGQLSNYG